MKDERNNQTLLWQYYQEGRAYNERLDPNQYILCDANTEFYAGNQWTHLPRTAAMSKLPKPVFNITKRVTNVQIANLMSGGVSVMLSPLAYYDGTSVTDPDSTACSFAQAEINNLFEKLRLEYRAREALLDGATTGDFCAHLYFDPTAQPYGGRANGVPMGEIKMELIDGINVMFGNPNSRDVQSQPYILLIGRDTVDNLQAEYKEHNPKDAKERCIQADSDYQFQTGIGGKTELYNSPHNAKATYGYLYTKVTKKVPMVDRDGNPVMEIVTDADGGIVFEKDKDGKPILDATGQPVPKKKQRDEWKTSVHVTKATRDAVIYEDVDTGLRLYPIAWGNWEKQKNQYHGRALITGIVPNQIFINSMFAMIMRYSQLLAFPKRIYNADLIAQFNNEIGADIGVRNIPPGMPISQVVTQLQGSDISGMLLNVIDRAMDYTKECLGSTDAQLGTSSLDNTSALVLMNTNSQTPLENIRANLNEWFEDIVRVMLDLMGTYYGERPIVRERTFNEVAFDESTGEPVLDQYSGMIKTTSTNRKVMEWFDFDAFKYLDFCISIKAGAGTVYNEATMLQTLDNLRREGVIELIDYLERVPDTVVPMRQALIRKLQAMQATQESGVPAGQALPMDGGAQAGDQMHQVLQQMNPDKVARQKKPGGGEPTADDAINALPINVKEQFDNLPPRAKGEVAKMAASRMQTVNGGKK